MIPYKRAAKKKDILSYSPKILKEKDICKLFYRKVMQMQAYSLFKGHFLLFHIANEQNASRAYTLSLMAMGLVPGVADYCIILPKGRVAFIEFKRNNKCKLTPAQKKFMAYCEIFEIPIACVSSVDEGIEFIHGLMK